MPTSNEDQWALAGTQALQQTQAEQLRNSVSQALPTNPDQEAQTRRYAAAAQVPLDTARALPDVVKQQAQMSTFDASVLARQFPTTAQYLSDTDNARLVHDDIPGTANVEQAIKALPKPAPAVNLMPPAEPVEPDKSILDTIGDNLKSLVSAPGAGSAPAALIKGLGGAFNKAAGAVNVVAGAAPTLYDKAASLITGKDDTSASDWWFKNMVDPRVAAAPVFEPNKDATFTEKAFHTTGNLLGMLAQITLTGGGGEVGAVTDAMPTAVVLGTRAAHGVKSMMFPALADAVDTGRRVYQETGDGVAAARAAQMQYATSTMAGVVPLSAPGTAAVRAATGFVSGVSLGEVSRTLMNTVMPDTMQTPYSGEELILSGLAGSVMGRVMGPQAEPAYHEAARRTYVDAAQFEAGQQGADRLHALGQISAASKLRERDPAAFKAFVDSVTEDGHLQDVFVDARELTNALNQSGMSDADLAARMPDVAAQMKEARETNGDVRIPVADYATHIAGGPIDEAILQHLKTEPEGKTYSEAQSFYQTQVESLKAEVQKIVDDHTNGEQIKASRDGIRDKILAQLTDVNRFTPQVNQHYADMHADYYTAMASRAGMTPEQFMDTYKLGVTGSLFTQSPMKMGATGTVGGTHFDQSPAGGARSAAVEAAAKFDAFDAKVLEDAKQGIEPNADEYFKLSEEVAKTEAALADRGVTDVRTYRKGDEADRAARIAEFENVFFQKDQEARGRIAFADDITRQASVMSLLKKADLSTFVHESGHFFLEVQADLARKIEARIAAGEEVSPGERGILGDMHTILDWMGIKGSPDVSAPEQWAEMSLEEKRDSHEQFARGFEAYALEGKSPSVGLTKAFQAFRSWLLHVYKQMTALRVELTPEVRSVFDRMLAADDAIKTAEQVRGYRPLFESAADAGMTPEDFATYQDLGREATADAADQLQARSLRDMKWMANAKSKAMKALQKEAASKRKEVRQQVTAEVMAQPVYQAWQFLTLRGDKSTQALPEEKADRVNVDPTVDNLFTAIAKHGGLNRDDVKTKWGVDHRDMPDSGVFGKPILRKSGGLSLERMAERLVEDHYLDAHDLAEFEMKFDRQADGQDQRSWQFDYSAGDRPAEGVDTPINYHGKLDLVELKRMFGDDSDVVRKLVEQRMTSAKAGLDPDIVAATVGHFESGRELIEQMFNAETPHKVIEGMTDQRMLEQHGDLIDAQSIERAAEAAIHNEARARFVASELRALASASDVRADNGTNKKGHRMTTSALAAAAKEAADAGIAAKRVRDIRPAQYAAAEARAAKMAEKALIGGDLPAAAVEKRAQLLNNRLVKAATEAIEEIRKGVQYLGKFDKAGVRANIDLEYRDQIDSLLDRYDLRKSTSNTALDKREALLAFVERMAEQGYEPQIPERLLNEANRSHFKDMTVEEFRGLVDAVKSIEHLGRLKTRLLDLKEMRELQALADEAVATTGALPQRDAESNRGLTSMEQKWLNVKSAGRSMQAALLKMEQMFDWLDGRDPNGVFNRVVFRRIADAGSNEANMQADIKSKIDALLHTHLADVTKEKGKIYTAPGLIDGLTGKPQKFTKKEMLSLAGNMGNESNTAKLVAGEKWNETAVWDFLHTNMVKADWDFVAGLGKTLETLWPEKLAMSRRLGNTNPDKIAPRPFDTPHGHYDGWYWPMVYDPARAQDVAERGAKAGDSLFENIYSRANTDTGRMNTRNENYARPLLLSLDTIPRVIKDEIHDIAYREAIIDADKFLSHKDVRESITNALSPEHYAQLKPWLQSIANDRKVDMAALKWFDQLAHGLRTRATIVGLGYRVSTMLVHGSSAAMESIAELGPTWMAKGLADFANPMQWSANRDFIFERSGEMRNRTNEVDRDVREHLREIELRLMDTTTGMVARGADMMKARAYQGIAMLDMASALPTWMGAYHRGMATEANGGHGMSEADAVYFADKTVRNAHGGSGAKDLAAVQRGPEFFKLFSMFYTFWNHNVNRLMDTARMAKSLPETYRTGEPGEFKGDLGLVIMRTLIYTLGVQAMHGMLHPSKDDEGETNWFAWAAKEFGSAAFAGIPVIRDVASHYISGKDYSPTPAAGIVDAIGASGMDAMNLMTGQEANPKALKHTITTAGYVFGLPLGQPASVAQFLWNVSQGQDHPETAGDWLRGVMHGESKQH